jgi:hypothetical protein
MIQQLENARNPDIIDGQVVLGTFDDLKKEHDFWIARVHRLREMLNKVRPGEFLPLPTGKRLREMARDANRGNSC